MRCSSKYVGLDVHEATTLATVRESSGRIIARSILPTEEAALLLTSLQTVFMREHNRLVDRIATLKPGLTAQEQYNLARKLVGAELQQIFRVRVHAEELHGVALVRPPLDPVGHAAHPSAA